MAEQPKAKPTGSFCHSDGSPCMLAQRQPRLVSLKGMFSMGYALYYISILNIYAIETESAWCTKHPKFDLSSLGHGGGINGALLLNVGK